MQPWPVIFVVVFFVVGAVMTFGPSIWWGLTQAWKNDSATEPSDLYLWITRIGGILFLILGVIGAAQRFFLT